MASDANTYALFSSGCFSLAAPGGNFDAWAHAGLDSQGRLIGEPWDHGLNPAFEISGVMECGFDDHDAAFALSGGDDQLITTRFTVYITAQRLVLVGQKAASGGLIERRLLNSMDGMPGGTRRYIVGQFRYEWITAVGFMDHPGWSQWTTLEFLLHNAREKRTSIKMCCKKGTDTRGLAMDLVRRIAKYKLTAEFGDKAHDDLQALASVEAPASVPKQTVWMSAGVGRLIPSGEQRRPPLSA